MLFACWINSWHWLYQGNIADSLSWNLIAGPKGHLKILSFKRPWLSHCFRATTKYYLLKCLWINKDQFKFLGGLWPQIFDCSLPAAGKYNFHNKNIPPPPYGPPPPLGHVAVLWVVAVKWCCCCSCCCMGLDTFLSALRTLLLYCLIFYSYCAY